MSIIDLFEERQQERRKIYGVLVGIVTNNQDPDNLNRVRVKLPLLSSDDESNWAPVTSFMAGPERGAVFLPEVDDEVLVVFERGDINRPFVIGALWNEKDQPPVTNSDGENNLRIIKSRSGHIIQLNDKDGEEKIEIIDSSGNNLIRIETQNNTITIQSDQDIAIKAPNGKVAIDAQVVEIKSSAAMKVEAGSTLDQKSSGSMTIKGATIDLN